MFKQLKRISIVLLSLISISAISAQTNTFTPTQTQAIEKIVHNYILKNPHILAEAARELQAQQEAQTESAQTTAIKANKKQLFQDTVTPTAGNPKATIYIAEFFDYQCGHCKTMADVVERVLKTDKNVKFFFKDLPIFGEESKFAALAAMAATQQHKYIIFHNALFNSEDVLDRDIILNIARKVGLDIPELTQDMKDPRYAARIAENFRLAREIGIMGTPAFIVTNKAETKFEFIPGAITQAQLQTIINNMNQ